MPRRGRPGRRLQLASRALGAAIGLLGAWYLQGWVTGQSTAAGLLAVTMKTNASLGLTLLGTALALGVPAERGDRLRRTLFVICGALALSIGGLTALENLSGWDLGIDQLLAREVPGAIGVESPNRMGFPASTACFLSGLAVIGLAGSGRRVARAQTMAMLVILIGLLPTIGYLYGVPSLYEITGLTAIALPTAIAVLAVGVSLLSARPHEGLVAPLIADDPGGHLLRRLLPPTLVVPLVMGWARLYVERRGWVPGSLATGLLMMFFAVAFSWLIVAGARRVNRWAEALTETQRERERLHETIAADRERLRAANERLRITFDSAGAGIAQLALDTGRFVRVNHQFVAMTGFSEEQLLGMTLMELTHPDQRDLAREGLALARSGTAPGGYFVERRYLCADGRVIDVELHGSVIRDAANRPAEGLIVVVDVTARNRAERDLAAAKISAEHARALAEEASRAKDHFLSVLSHELRTPLSPVITGLGLLARERLTGGARGVVEVVRRNVELEARLIDDLLDLTKIERGKVELDRQHIELCAVIEHALEVCQTEIDARTLKVGLDFGPRPYYVNADAGRLQQAFWNLLKNAIKFTPEGGCIGIRCRREGDEVVVAIADSGIGIDPAAIDRIFDAFAQAERSITRQYGGLGLGLAITRALVELHGGTVRAESEGRDQGATFVVRLPTVSGEPADAPREVGEAAAGEACGDLRILLVEDHADTADLMVTMLEMEGHSVVVARNVAAGFEAFSAGEFDVLVSDLGLPDGSGLDLLKELRARGRRLPAIALSGYGQETDLQRSRAAGFVEHLVKPVEPHVLLDAIRRVVRPGQQP